MNDWRDRAACLDAVDADFFPVWSCEYEAAREVCQTCPVRIACLDDAMTAEGSGCGTARYGMRGGLTPAERATRYRASTPSGTTPAVEERGEMRRHSQERRGVVATLTERGLSATQISLRIGVSPRQIRRDRDQIRGAR